MGVIVKSWGPESKMGAFMMKHFDQFETVYPPYINYLDSSQKLVKELENTNPRFNAFCRARMAKGTYNRQSLSGNYLFAQVLQYVCT